MQSKLRGGSTNPNAYNQFLMTGVTHLETELISSLLMIFIALVQLHVALSVWNMGKLIFRVRVSKMSSFVA